MGGESGGGNDAVKKKKILENTVIIIVFVVVVAAADAAVVVPVTTLSPYVVNLGATSIFVLLFINFFPCFSFTSSCWCPFSCCNISI